MAQTKVAKRKSTFFLSEDLLAEMKETVTATGMRSQNAIVEEAVRNYIVRIKREELRRRYLEASRDPLFLFDVDEVEKDFQQSDAETARMIR